MSSGNIINKSMGVPIGRMGVWWFLASEIAIFGGLVMTFLLLRMHNPQWGEEASHTILWAGATNTVVLLTSSLTVVLAHDAAARKKFILASNLIYVTLFFGGMFMAIKAYEYSHEIHGGFTPSASPFWGFYFFMTGLHAFHVFGGMIIMAIVAVKVRQGKMSVGVEYAGIYWHFVDLVWIFLFPLLYIAS